MAPLTVATPFSSIMAPLAVTVGATLFTVTVAVAVPTPPSSSVTVTVIGLSSLGVPVGSSSRYWCCSLKVVVPAP